MARLKVFRTPIGFHDAYVAASSRKAALAAWGSDKDLFARGAAEEVTDAALAAEPLASPGVVIRRLRGTAAEQIAALPPDRPAAAAKRRAAEPPLPAAKPSRAELAAAEAAVAAAETRHAAALTHLADREAALVRERRALEREQADEIERLGDARDRADAAYRKALRR